MVTPDISCSVNSIDPDQLASNRVDQDPLCFHSTCKHKLRIAIL